VFDSYKSFALRILCVLLSLALLAGSAVCVYAEDSIDELTSQKDDLALRQEELAAKRDEAAASLEEQQEQSNVIREQIAAKSEEIALNEQILTELDRKIRNTSEMIASKEEEIAKREQEIHLRRETLRTRLRAISKKSVLLSFFQFLFGRNSYADFLMGFKVTERVSENDQQMMDALEADIAALETAKNKLKTDKAALEIERSQAEAIRNDTAQDKDSLQQLYNESDALAQEMAQDVNYLQHQLDETLSKQQALQTEIDAILERIRAEEEAARKEAEENGEEYRPSDDLIFTGNGDGTMLWPTPTCPVITSSFGWREWSETWHKGIDIACYGDAEGEPIVAAADGVVHVFYDEYGYGNYITIDHGYDSDGCRVLTVYAHCSRVDVSYGDTVTAGQQIGLVGDTGRSDGAHLHFEVNIDGVAVDPISNGYLTTDGIDVLN